MNAPVKPVHQVDISVRKNLNFKLRGNLPRFWVNNEPFLTRMFDALSLTFPVGERYFISSVRAYRDQITDPVLQQKVADFIMQEAQHGIAHDDMNRLMAEQGMPVDNMIALVEERLDYLLQHRSAQYNIACTAASEHLTALMAECFFSKKSTLDMADPYARSLFAWHAIEEMEHRDVAFDVMQQIAQVPYVLRAYALIEVSILMSVFTMLRANTMLKADKFTLRERIQLFKKGIPWFLGKNGKLTAMRRQYLDWFKRDFHPSQHPILKQYPIWIETLARTGDPLAAGNALWEAAE